MQLSLPWVYNSSPAYRIDTAWQVGKLRLDELVGPKPQVFWVDPASQKVLEGVAWPELDAPPLYSQPQPLCGSAVGETRGLGSVRGMAFLPHSCGSPPELQPFNIFLGTRVAN